MHGAAPTHPIFLILGLGVFLVCGVLGARRIEGWRKAEGFAPAPSLTRDGNREYKKLLWLSMPMQLQTKVWRLWFIGFVSAVIGMWLAT